MQTAGLLLALFALTFEALLPPGYMLSPTRGGMAITLCSLGGPVEVVLDPLTGAPVETPPAPQPDHDKAAPCAFAVSAPLSVAEAPPEAPAPRTTLALEDTRRTIARADATPLAAPPPWATGPPLSI